MVSAKEKESFLDLTRRVLWNPYFFVGAVSNFTYFFSIMVVVALTPMRAQFEYKMTSEQGFFFCFNVKLNVFKNLRFS